MNVGHGEDNRAELNLLGAVVNNANDAILVTEAWPVEEPGPRIVYVNEAFSRMTGYTSEEIIGETPRVLQGPATERFRLDEIRAALENWEPIRIEVFNYRKDGTEFWVELNIVPVPDENGYYTHWISIQREITERKRHEAEQRRNEERVQTALAQNSSGFVEIIGEDRIIRYTSPSVENVLGFLPEEMAGNSFTKYLHPEDVKPVQDAFYSIAESPGIGKPVELRAWHRDGSWRHLEAVGRNMIEDPSIGGVVINAWDITQRKQVEDELRLRDRAIAASSNGVIISDPNQPDNPIIYVNPRFEQITGYPAEEVIGRNCRFLQGEEYENQPVLEGLRIAIREGREWSGPLRNLRKDGILFWNELYIAPVRDKSGNIANFVGIQQDITDRKVLEEQLTYQAFHDPLTDLPNRTLFLDRLEQAHTLNLGVTAEGVETEDQLACLLEMKCNLAQGFYLWKPASAEKTADILAEQLRS